MILHYVTLLTVSAAVIGTQGLFLFLFWLLDRRARALRWWAGAFMAIAISQLILGVWSGARPAVLHLAIGLMILGYAAIWQATRAFEGRPPRPMLMLVGPLAWLLAYVDGPLSGASLVGMPLFSYISAGYLALAVMEVWRSRGDTLPSRTPLAVAISVACASFAGRAIFDSTLGPGVQPTGNDLQIICLFVMVTLMALSAGGALALALSKERLQQMHDGKLQVDEATGALNLNAFLSHASRLTAGQMKDRRPVGLLLMHLGDGSARGARDAAIADDDLRVFHDQVVARLRPTDLIARVGTQNFALVIPNASPADVLGIGKRVARLAQEALGGEAGIPVTIGAVSSVQVGYDLRTLIFAADAAVEEAKDVGPGHICLYRSRGDAAGRADAIVPWTDHPLAARFRNLTQIEAPQN